MRELGQGQYVCAQMKMSKGGTLQVCQPLMRHDMNRFALFSSKSVSASYLECIIATNALILHLWRALLPLEILVIAADVAFLQRLCHAPRLRPRLAAAHFAGRKSESSTTERGCQMHVAGQTRHFVPFAPLDETIPIVLLR